jgi:predicted unusual protein kinase regulating ubiquinone biosynthesis (AarF/ABC1/UbiB family)
LAQLQSDVPPDPPGSAESTVKSELGVGVGDAFGTFEAMTSRERRGQLGKGKPTRLTPSRSSDYRA